MGAEYQGGIVEAGSEEALHIKYRDIVSHCRHMDGHGGYTGTFAEKDGLEVIPGTHTREGAREHCSEENPKWGPSYAYDLGDNKWYIGGWCSS